VHTPVVDPAYGYVPGAEQACHGPLSAYCTLIACRSPNPVQPLSDAEVRKVARLARLAILEDRIHRIHRLRHQLTAVLTYIDRLRRVDLECWADGARRLGGEQA
jgi:hypothetical protein